MAILGPDGRPLKPSKTELSTEVAKPSLSGVRRVHTGTSAAAGLRPERLATILRSAADRDAHDYLTLAEEMEERDWHYASELGKRKQAITGLEPTIKAAGNDARANEIAAAVQADILEDEAFDDLTAGLLDALGKGYAAVEIAWDTTKRWKPSGYEWRDPRWFRFDRETGKTLRLLDDAGGHEGIELPPYRFAIHLPRLKMGLPVRGGLARLAAWAFLFKFYNVKDWAAFAETYGQPLRLGKYDASATVEDVEVLQQAVAMIGTDYAATIPESMHIEFIQAASGASGAELYERFVDWLDRQVSKAVVGQTGTADVQKGGGYAQSKVLNDVRLDIALSDARQLARTIRRDVIEPYVRFNWGPDAAVPLLGFSFQQEEDLKALSEALVPLIDRGLSVKASEMRQRFGLADPGKDTDVLRPAGSAQPIAPSDADTEPSAVALNRADATTKPDDIDELVWAALGEGQDDMAAMLDPVLAAVDAADDFEGLKARLVQAVPGMDAERLASRLAKASFKARGLGDASDG